MDVCASSTHLFDSVFAKERARNNFATWNTDAVRTEPFGCTQESRAICIHSSFD